jgi:hypothetical protein
MTNTPNDQPLWRVMADAHDADVGTVEDVYGNEYSGTPDERTYAAMLCAIADRVVPEEWLPEPDEESMMDMRVWEAVSQRQRIRRLLLAEADRAEAGE